MPEESSLPPEDTGPEGTGPEGTGPEGTGPEDTGPEDTGPEDAPPPPPEAPPAMAAAPASGPLPGADKKVLAGILGIVLGALGIHKFVLGYTTEGIVMLLISVVVGFFTCFIATGVIGVIGLIEGIIYLTKSDEEFVATYVEGRKGWF